MGTLDRNTLEGQRSLGSHISVGRVFRRGGRLFRVAHLWPFAEVSESLEKGVVILEGDNYPGSLAGSVSKKQDRMVHCVTYTKV
jgi:hypothetical protein